MTSNHHAPYDLGYTRTTMGVNRRKQYREVEQTRKPLSQFGSGLQLAYREVGIASNRRSAYCGEYVPGPCTPARHTTKVGSAQSRWGNLRSGSRLR